MPVQFEWDADKAALNLKKLGVRFKVLTLLCSEQSISVPHGRQALSIIFPVFPLLAVATISS